MLHHVSLPVSDLAVSKRMYDEALGALGYRCVYADDTNVCYGVEDDEDILCLKRRTEVSPASDGFHLAFAAPSPNAVARFHDAAIRNGGSDAGEPGLRPHYGPTYYAAFVVDPDGHHLEAVNK